MAGKRAFQGERMAEVKARGTEVLDCLENDQHLLGSWFTSMSCK